MARDLVSGGGGANAPATRCIAIMGTFQSGKTTLLEAILERTGAIKRQGTIAAGNTVGDSSPEARAHQMSVELNVASTTFMGERYDFIDCSGSVEFMNEGRSVLGVADTVVVVCDPDPKRVAALSQILRPLQERKIPHVLFLNKIDKATDRVRDMLETLQQASTTPLVLRQVPIWEKGIATGYVDLALERAFLYREHAPSAVIEMPASIKGREEEARFSMLETLADYDDELMEQLLDDMEPPRDKVFDDLTAEVRDALICPVLLGSAEHGNGVSRLLKALRHEVQPVTVAAKRAGLNGKAAAIVFKTRHTGHGGKLSLARVMTGAFKDGDTVYKADGEAGRIAGVFKMLGQDAGKCDKAAAGDVVALGRLNGTETGDVIALEPDAAPKAIGPLSPPPVFGLAINPKHRKDDVKLTGAIQSILEEDPSLSLAHRQDTGEMVLWGQGEMHLRVAFERLKARHGIEVESRAPAVGYCETIRKPVIQRGRHKKQSGGHGQFGDVVLEVKPRPAGSGFEFTNTISGGVVPRQYFSAVEAGTKDAMTQGPLGFPVVDVAVNLSDGSYHSVDSSEQAFRAAGRLAMAEALAAASPVLLEPVLQLAVTVPNEAMSKINAIITGRRGQILGFDAHSEWQGWDVIEAQMPEAEARDLIIELRSVSSGVGTFTFAHDHFAELTGKLAEKVVQGGSAKAA